MQTVLKITSGNLKAVVKCNVCMDKLKFVQNIVQGKLDILLLSGDRGFAKVHAPHCSVPEQFSRWSIHWTFNLQRCTDHYLKPIRVVKAKGLWLLLTDTRNVTFLVRLHQNFALHSRHEQKGLLKESYVNLKSHVCVGKQKNTKNGLLVTDTSCHWQIKWSKCRTSCCTYNITNCVKIWALSGHVTVYPVRNLLKALWKYSINRSNYRIKKSISKT